ncbi:hypothetical protein CRYUN_Cryun26dG0014800 [Craigia yunnanensis]
MLYTVSDSVRLNYLSEIDINISRIPNGNGILVGPQLHLILVPMIFTSSVTFKTPDTWRTYGVRQFFNRRTNLDLSDFLRKDRRFVEI